MLNPFKRKPDSDPVPGLNESDSARLNAAADRIEEILEVSETIKDVWWEVFSNALYKSIDDQDELLRLTDDRAIRCAQCARALADAAVTEYEQRFAIDQAKSHARVSDEDLELKDLHDALYGISHLIDDWANSTTPIPSSLQAFKAIEGVIQETRQGESHA